jgi:hypothetical protein
MSRSVLLSAVIFLIYGCKPGMEALVPTDLDVSPQTVALDGLGATQVVRATVRDQHGNPLPGAAVTWSSNSPVVSVTALGDSAVVRAEAEGQAQVTAASGGASAALPVHVTQTPAVIRQPAGGIQAGPAGGDLPEPIVVRVEDRTGGGIHGVPVTFTVLTGGGSLTVAEVVTGMDGTASTIWTVGTVAGSSQQVSASAEGLDAAYFTAIVYGAAPASAAPSGPDRFLWVAGDVLPWEPRVEVLDAYGNPSPAAPVRFTVTSGGGAVAHDSVTTSDRGIAGVRWTLGPDPGENTLTATFPGTSVPPVTFTATARLDGTLTISAGEYQAGMAGEAVPVPPRVRLRDPDGRPVSGATVTFRVLSGGGMVTGARVDTDADGYAEVGSWVLGSVASINVLTATVEDYMAWVQFRGAGCSGGGGGGYEVTICWVTPVSSRLQEAIEWAGARWSRVVVGDLPAVPVNARAGECGTRSPAVDLVVDDLLIFAAEVDIDGPGGVLGQAGWCFTRSGGLPVVGLMEFDAADVAALSWTSVLDDLVLHEMGHVLGIGSSLWSGLLRDPSGPGSSLDTHFVGAGAIAAFDAIGGSGYSGHKVPVENTGGPGTVNAHWRESVFGSELMTGWLLEWEKNPLSIVTVRSLADLGYVVDPSAADSFRLAQTDHPREGGVLHLEKDEYAGPRYTIDPSGRRTLIRP